MNLFKNNKGSAGMFIFWIVVISGLCGLVWYATGNMMQSSQRIFSMDSRAQAYYEEGLKAEKEGDIDKAIIKFDAACDVDNFFKQARLKAGDLYRQKGNDDKAALHYGYCVDEINSENIEIAEFLGDYYINTKEGDWKMRYDKAADLYKKIVKYDKNKLEVYIKLANVYYKQKEKTLAKAVLAELIKISPDSEEGKKAKKILAQIQ